MPPENQNTGSFGAPVGGAQALKAAMQRRGIDASALDQVSPAAPGDQSPVAPNVPADARQVGPQPSPTDGQASPSVEQPEQQPRSAEMAIALEALADVVKTERKIAEQSLQLASGGLV